MKTHVDKEVLQLVNRDAMEAHRQGRETEHLRGSQEKEVLELSTAVHRRYLDSSNQRRLDMRTSSSTG